MFGALASPVLVLELIFTGLTEGQRVALEGGQPEAGSRAASDHIRMLTMRGRGRRGIMAATPRLVWVVPHVAL
jgi:hypothetical protein